MEMWRRLVATRSPVHTQISAGQAVVEFAIVLPVLLLLMIGLINIGVLMNSQIILTQAAWEGARTGATIDPLAGEGDAEIQGAVHASLSGLSDPSAVTIEISPEEWARAVMSWPQPRGSSIAVRLSYPLKLAFPLPVSISLGAEAISRIEYSNPP